MRLLEAIVAANQAAVAGHSTEVRVEHSVDSLPLAVLTCIDPRLNKFFPGALGLTEEQLIWLRNAGNVITNPLSSTVRSIAISVYLKSAKEIAVIGHTDCKMAKMSMAELLDRLKEWGIDRNALPMANLHEFFGLFTSEKANVMKAVGCLRVSPIIPPRIPVHGLIIDTNTGRLEWTVNGYEAPHLSVDITAAAEEALGGVLPPQVAGYVAGPLRSLAEHLAPLSVQQPETIPPKTVEARVEKPPAAKPPLPPTTKPPPIKVRERGPYR
ncbi:MAG TPA: carbonic anhydrase [Verrucomicrobiae bacterium]|nr:carbonic anhydrase [Verrucomicrobiae bacterium]